MKKWEQRWWGRRAVGIEVAIGNEGRSWRGVAVEACGACFRMREQREGFGQLEGLRLARRPVVLWLRGKRVLTRVVRAADEYTMLASVLPEERRGDFVYCFYPEAGTGQVRVVLVQRVEVEALLAEVRALRGFVAGWVLGEREGEAALEAPYRLAYEAACSFFKGVDREELERFFPEERAEDYRDFRRGQWLWRGAVIVCLGMLAVHFGVRGEVERELERCGFQVERQREIGIRLDSLKRRYADCLQYITAKGLGEASTYAYYCDRIAGCVPEGMCLWRLEVAAPWKRLREEEEVPYREGLLFLQGEAMNAEVVAQLMEALQAEEWVERVNYHDYATEPEGNVFHIEIQMRGDDDETTI